MSTMLIQMGPTSHVADQPPSLNRAASSSVVEGDIVRPDIVAMKRFNDLRDLAPDSPIVTLFYDAILLCVDLFKLTLATMLSVFVPQRCPENESLVCLQSNPGDPACLSLETNCNDEPFPHTCDFEENFRCLTPFNQFVLAWNFICLGALTIHYFLVWNREKYIITHFKESIIESRIHVKDVIHQFPSVNAKLYQLNNFVFIVSAVCIILQIVNVIISGVLLFRDYNDGYKTYTTFFANVLLITAVLFNCANASYVGLKHSLAFSCVAFEPVSFNTILDGYKGQ